MALGVQQMEDKIDFEDIRTLSLNQRRDKVRVKEFGSLVEVSEPLVKFIDSLPDILGGKALKELAREIARRSGEGKLVGLAMGAHPIKCGTSPHLIDLMERGIINFLAMNGAGAIHDFEIAFCGRTSEDVERELAEGRFGMARETAEAFRKALEKKLGLGEALGELVLEQNLPYADYSLLASARKLGVRACVLVAFGTDVVHIHPRIDPARLGEATYYDFKGVCSAAESLSGGVWLNVGSAVIMPEVFLKALAYCSSAGRMPEEFITANFDMIYQYRPRMNVIERPQGRGYNFIGQHEIMLPLLRVAVLSFHSGRGRS